MTTGVWGVLRLVWIPALAGLSFYFVTSSMLGDPGAQPEASEQASGWDRLMTGSKKSEPAKKRRTPRRQEYITP